MLQKRPLRRTFVVTPAPDSSSASVSSPKDAALCAVLILDAMGKVVASNRSARELWGTGSASLVGLTFAQLFAIETVSGNALVAEAQWKSQTAASLDRWTTATVQPKHGPAREVLLRLERSFGGAGSYIGMVQAH